MTDYERHGDEALPDPGESSFNDSPVRQSLDHSQRDVPQRGLDRSLNDRDGGIQMTNFDATHDSRKSRATNRSGGSRSRARDVSRPKVEEKAKVKQPEKVAKVRLLQTRIIYLNALTVFLTVVFLQVMMFYFTAVPMTNGILMSTGSSVAYFVLSILTLLFLYECHEATQYMILLYQCYLVLTYGIIILILGILCAAIDVGATSEAVDKIWPTMSTNQKDFFGIGDDVQKIALKDLRSHCTLCASMFGISVGILLEIQGALLFVLRRQRDELVDANIEWSPEELKSRAINKVLTHEKCEFRYITRFEDKHLKILGLDKKKKKTRPTGLEESDQDRQDEYSFNEDEDDMDYSIRSEYDEAHQTGQNANEYDQEGFGGTMNNKSNMSGEDSQDSFDRSRGRSRGGSRRR